MGNETSVPESHGSSQTWESGHEWDPSRFQPQEQDYKIQGSAPQPEVVKNYELPTGLGLPKDPSPKDSIPVVDDYTGFDEYLNSDETKFAVIGYHIRLPGADTIEQFYDILYNKKRIHTDLTKEGSNDEDGNVKGRFEIRNIDLVGWQNPLQFATRYANVIGGGSFFDASFFGIGPREAGLIDTDQRCLLNTSWYALEHAGLDPLSLRGKKVAVVIGSQVTSSCTFGTDYGHNEYSLTGGSNAILANRISAFYGLEGASFVVNTACSSTLYAFDLAHKLLRAGSAEMAIVGGTNTLFSAHIFARFAQLGVISKSGYCNSFADNADGYLRSEGNGIFVITSLRKAVQSGRKIRAVIRETHSNCASPDQINGLAFGRPLTAPTTSGQYHLMTFGYKKAGLEMKDIDFIEAHATGTLVGDGVEMTAISSTIGQREDNPCIVGGVKSNVGHLEGGSGVPALAKVLLMFEHRTFLPTAIEHPAPIIEQQTSVELLLEPRPFPDKKVIVGINSFGIGGSNSLVILEEFKPPFPIAKLYSKPITTHPSKAYLFPVSARSQFGLNGLIEKYAELVENTSDIDLYRLAGNMSVNRGHYFIRTSFVSNSREDLAAQLNKWSQKKKFTQLPESKPPKSRIGFIFSGQGGQWLGCGAQLYASEPVFKAVVDEMHDIYVTFSGGWSPREPLLNENSSCRVDDVTVAQPLLFFYQVAVFHLLLSWGIKPSVVLGHSAGELGAVLASGAIPLADMLKITHIRAHLQASQSGKGRLLAVGISQQVAEDEYVNPSGGKINIAAVNSHLSVTLVGEEAKLQTVLEACEAKGIFARFVVGNIPFHSPAMEGLREKSLSEFAAPCSSLREVQHQIVSTVTGDFHTTFNAAYWFSNIRQPVSFQRALIKSLSHADVFVELSPHGVLTASVQDVVGAHGSSHECYSTGIRNKNDAYSFHEAIGKLYDAGIQLTWTNIYPRPEPLDSLPHHPYETKNVINHTQEPELLVVWGPYHHGPIVGKRTWSDQSMFTTCVSTRHYPYLEDHVVQRTIIAPGGYFLEGLLEAATAMEFKWPIRLRNMKLAKPLILKPKRKEMQQEKPHHIQFKIGHAGLDGVREFTVVSTENKFEDEIIVHSTGYLETGVTGFTPIGFPEYIPPPVLPAGEEAMIKEFREPRTQKYDLYDRIHPNKYFYGPSLRVIEWMRYDPATNRYLAKIIMDEDIFKKCQQMGYLYTPILLDGIMQVFLIMESMNDDYNSVPSEIEQFIFYRPPPSNVVYCVYHAPSAPNKNDPMLGMLNNGSVDVYTESGDLIASQRHYWCFLSKSDAVTTDIGFGVVQQNKVLPIVAPSAPTPKVGEVSSKVLELAAEQSKIVLKTLSDRSPASESEEDKFALSEFVTKALPSLFTSVKAGAIPDDVRNSAAGTLITGVAQRMAEALREHRDYNDHGAWSDAQLALDPIRGSLVHTIAQVSSWAEKAVSKSIGVRARVTRIAEVGNVPFGRLLLSHSSSNAILNNRNVQWTILSNNSGLLKQAERTKTEVRPIPVSNWDSFQPPELLEGLYDYVIVHGTGFVPGADVNAKKATLSKVIKALTTILSPGGVLILEGITAAPEWLKFIAANQHQTINNLTVDLDTWVSALDDTPSYLEPAIDVKLEGSLFYAVQKKRTLEPSPLKANAPERRALLFSDSNGFAKKFAKLCVDDDRFPISTVVVQETDLVEDENEDAPVPDFPRSIGKSTLVPNCPASGPALRKLLATYGDVTDIVVFAPISDNSNFAMESWLTIVALCKALIHGRDEDSEGSSKYIKEKLLWVVTQGASLDTPRPHLSCLHGLMRSAGQELLSVGTLVKIIDIGSIADLPQLHKVILQPSADHEINIRGQNVFVPRLVVLDESSSTQKDSKSTLEYYYRLNCTGSQDIAQMEWIFYPPPALPEWAVDVNVKAAALNLRDLMVAMGMLDKSSFNYSALGRCVGIECSGHVARVGKDVKEFKGGEAVIATGPATIASVAQMAEPMVVVKPKNISFEEGAGIPSVYITALYALEHLARLAEGESVLIHSALGGVGQAAMSIAFAVGATVYATAGTEEKRQLLRDMGCEEVFDSRSLSWADALMKATNGKGVDVVLNSLAGEHIAKGLSVLKPSGRYCEIGKRDIYDNSKIGMMALRKNISFFIIDIDQLSLNSPAVVSKFLKKVVDKITTGVYKAPQVTNFKFINFLDAFRLMQKGTHTGKLILVRDDESDKVISKKAPKSFTLFQSDKKYFIAGGFGGVGPYMIKFMAELGAKKFILADRDQQRRRSAKNIHEYVRLDSDVEIEVVQGDVAIKADVDRMIAGSTPLGAIVQLAGVLQDASIVNESRIRYQTTLNPKAQAALFLHEASKELPVEHFIMFSSVASTFGSAGQGSYSSANAFLDALTRHRLAMGLPATVYNMGPICDAGMALRDSFARKHFHMTGVAAMRTTVALGVLENAIRHRLSQVVSMQFIKGDNQPMGNNVLLMEHVMPAMKEQAAGGTESFADVLAEVIAQIGEVAGVENIDADRGLSTYGIDSFMGTDLSGWLKRRYGVNISQLEIVIKFSAKTLAEAVVAQKSGVAVTESDDHEEDEEDTGKEGDEKTIVNSEYSPSLESHFPGTKFGDVILQGEDHRVKALSAKTKVKVDAPVSLSDVSKYWTEVNKVDPSTFPYATLKAKFVDMVKKYISVTYKSKAVARHFRPVLASDKISEEGVGLPNKEIAYPLTDVKSEGSYIWDVDGNKLIDTVAGHGSVFYGHKAEFIQDAIEKRQKYGYNVATQSELAGEVAQLIVDLTGAQRVTFTQTGTEAVAQAVRVARSYTKKPKVVVFEGHYHGNDDTFLQRPWAQLDLSFPAAEGVVFNDNVLALPFSLSAIPKIRKNKDSIAAIVLEPVPSLSSRVDPTLLHALRAVATECGIVLIFDEVYTGFRCNVGGAQSYFGVRADLVTYGLVLGGGLPLGVLAGSEPLLKVIDGGVWQYGDQSLPVNRTASSGTFAGHPLALAAARAILWKFKESPNQDQVSLNVRVRHLFDDLKAFFVGKPVPFALNAFGSTLSFNAAQADLQWVRLFEQLLVLKGVYMARHRMIFTVAHNDRDYAYVSKAIKSTYKELFDPNLNVSIDIPHYLARDTKPDLGEDYIAAHNINVAFNEVSDAQWSVKGEEELFQAYDQINALQTGTIAAVPSESWSSILVTGATGFVGRFVLDQILKTSKAKVYALVRGANETLAQKRLQFALKEAKLTSEYPASRLVVVNGDLEKDNFGLSQSVYDELLNVDAVFHLGANTTAQKPYNEVKAANVQGTQRVIKFSVTNKLKWLVYYSSLSIFPAYSANFAGAHALRSSINEDQKPKTSEIPVADGYSKSKLIAEKLVEKARARHGLPVVILRSGNVWADSKNGFTTGKDFFTKFIRTAVHVKAIPDNDQLREISPVDVIADVSVKTALRRASSNTSIADQHVFHVLSSEGRTNGQIARMLQNLGFPKVKLVTPSEFVNSVASSSGTPLTSASLSGLTKDTKVTSFGERILAYSYLDEPVSVPVSVHNVEGNWPSAAHVLNSGLKFLKSQGLLGR